MGMMRAGHPVRLTRICELPQEAAAERESAATAGVKSHLCLPLSSHGCALGGVALTCFDSERTWPDELIEQMRVIGQILSTLLTLNSMQMKLRQSVGELTHARDGLQEESNRLQEEIRVIQPPGELVGRSSAIGEVLEKVRQVAATQSTALILGRPAQARNWWHVRSTIKARAGPSQ
jgi:transcriptional regulator with GAF, ATPase, and Fis domain